MTFTRKSLLIAAIFTCSATATIAQASEVAGPNQEIRSTLTSIPTEPHFVPNKAVPMNIPGWVAKILSPSGLLSHGYRGTTNIQYAVFAPDENSRIVVFTDDESCPSENGSDSDLSPVECKVQILNIRKNDPNILKTTIKGCVDQTVYNDDPSLALYAPQNGTYYSYNPKTHDITGKSLYKGVEHKECRFTAKVPE